MNKHEIINELRESDYQLTPQREYLIELCLKHDGHFTAKDLFNFDQKQENQLSRATVYNTIHCLVEIGFLRVLPDMGPSDYYEINRESHPHAQCRACGDLIDIPVNLEKQVQNWNLPFQIDSVRMTVDGLCQSCSEEPVPAVR